MTEAAGFHAGGAAPKAARKASAVAFAGKGPGSGFAKRSFDGAHVGLRYFLLLCACAWMACARSPMVAEPSFEQCVKRYDQLTVELGQRDPDSLDFAFGLEDGESSGRESPPTLSQLRDQLAALDEQLQHLWLKDEREQRRRASLRAQVEALELRSVQVTGREVAFDVESQRYFGVVAPPDDGARRRQAVREEIKRVLGHPRDTAAALAKVEARLVVPPQRLPAVMDAALAACRSATLQHMALPADESVRVRYVSLQPWTGYSRYMGHDQSVIEINTDYPLTVDRVLDLACHEGYPGHHVFNLLRDRALVEQQHLDEFRVQPTFSPQSYVSEAAANYASRLAMSPDERLRVEENTLAPIAGIHGDLRLALHIQELLAELDTGIPSIARDYLDGQLEFERASEALERETLMPRAEPILLYLNEYRSYAVTYTLGAAEFRRLMEAGSPNELERWARYRMWAESPKTSLLQ